MKYLASFFLLSACLLLGKVSVAAGPGGTAVAPGRYVSVGDWGELVVKKVSGGQTRFEIETMGGNCHVCSLNGVLRGNTGQTDDDAGAGESGRCKVSLQPVSGGIEVSALTGEACQYYCGMRAGFNGLYKIPPAGCTSKEQKARRAEFLTLYRAKKHGEARNVLSSLLEECHDFINWIEIDRVRNDLALAQYHAGDPAACLATLGETRAGKARDADDLGLPPCDHDNYLGTAKATWHNQKLCGKVR